MIAAGIPAAVLLNGAEEALLLVVAVSLPIVGIAALVGMIVAAFQAATQIQDPTLAHLPRLVAVGAALALLGPWIGHQITAFAEQMFRLAGL